MSGPSRRTVLAGTAAAVGSPLCAGALKGVQDPAPSKNAPSPTSLRNLPLRDLGQTGRKLPLLGLGCYPLGNLADENAGVAILQAALESGARYLDTAPSYGSGRSEKRIGLGIQSWPREDLFVATKTLERDGDAALVELEQSLERLGTDYVDSVQVHEVRSSADVKRIFGKSGVIKALESARDKKKLRHIGITGHRDPKFLLEAIEIYDFATVLVPVNPLDCHHLSFTTQFLPRALQKGIGVIAMKVFAGGALPKQKPAIQTASLIRFALSQPGVSLAVPGSDSLERWQLARKSAVEPVLKAEEQQRLIADTGPHRGKSSEWYKNSS